jgi:transposase-like protein
MEASQQGIQIPPEIQAIADNLGVDVSALMAQVQQAGQQEQPAAGGAEVAADVKVVPTEDPQARLERELAEARNETQEVRRLAQVAEEGRVIGSGGVGIPGQAPEPPNLGSIEPGIRWSYKNGLITDEQLTEQVGPLLANMLKDHQGGVI